MTGYPPQIFSSVDPLLSLLMGSVDSLLSNCCLLFFAVIYLVHQMLFT